MTQLYRAGERTVSDKKDSFKCPYCLEGMLEIKDGLKIGAFDVVCNNCSSVWVDADDVLKMNQSRREAMESLIEVIAKEFELEKTDVTKVYANDSYKDFRKGILEGLRLAEIIVKQQLKKGQERSTWKN